MVRLITKGTSERNYNRIAMKMLPVLIFILIVFMFLFNQSSDKVLKAYYNITNKTSADTGSAGAHFVLLPHHFLLVMIVIGTIVVIAFAVYILSSIDSNKDYVDTSWDS